MPTLAQKHDHNGEQLSRIRRICSALPGTSERLSHGEPTFFVGDKTFAMFANNHHHDGHVAVWAAAAPGTQPTLIRTSPAKFFRPPYVGVRGWVGIELDQVSDDELAYHLLAAWRYIAPPRLKATVDSAMRHALI
jgi:hypothetical protein